MINAMILILIQLIFRFWMATFLAVLLMVYTCRNLLGLLESAIIMRASTREINVLQQEYWYHLLRKTFWLGIELLVCCLANRASTGVFLLLRVSVSYSALRDLHLRATY